MSDYRKILNPYTGESQRVLSDTYIQSVTGGGGSSDYDPVKIFYVNNQRTDIYTETGSIIKPFKTIQAAANKIISIAYGSPFVYVVKIYGNYQETITLENNNLSAAQIIFQGENLKSLNAASWYPASGQTYSVISTQNNPSLRLYFDNIRMGAMNLKLGSNNLYLYMNNCNLNESTQSIFEGLRHCYLLNVTTRNVKFINCNGLRIYYHPNESQYPTMVNQGITIELDNTKLKSAGFSNPMYTELMNLDMRSITILDDPSSILNLKLILKESTIGNINTPPTYTISNLQTWYLINSFLFGSIINNGTLHVLNSEYTGTITGNTPIYGVTNKPTISSGIVAPTSTPTKIGDVYLDIVLKKIYFATGTTNSADWTIVN